MPFGKHQKQFLNNGFFSGHALWSVWLKVVLWTDTPIFAVELCSSLMGIFGLFVAFLISFGGRPSLGRFLVVPYSLHYFIIYLMVLRGMFKVSDIFL